MDRHYRHWRWKIEHASGQDRVTLDFVRWGGARVRLNGRLLSNTQLTPTGLRFSLSDGRDAELALPPDWQSRGVPPCELSVGDTVIDPTFNEDSEKQPPALTPQNRFALMAFEIYLAALIVLIPLWFALFTDNHRFKLKHVLLGLGVIIATLSFLRSRRSLRASAQRHQRTYWEQLYRQIYFAIQSPDETPTPKTSYRRLKLATAASLVAGSVGILSLGVGSPAIRLMAWLYLGIGPITFLYTFVFDDLR